MADLPEDPLNWPAGIYQLEVADAVLGGLPNIATGAGKSNIPLVQLADRTAWLRAAVDLLTASLPGTVELAGSGYQVLPSGLILQWGGGTVSNGHGTGIWPITFPNACFHAVATDIGPGQHTYGINPTAAGWEVWSSLPNGNTPTVDSLFHYLAVGW